MVLNAAVLWTTRYLDAAVGRLRALPPEEREHDVRGEDVARLSPLKDANLTCWVATASARRSRPTAACARCVTRTSASTPTTEPHPRRLAVRCTTTAGLGRPGRATREAGEGAVQTASGAPWWALSASAVLG
ncbi:hypothetical protein JRC61_28560 [Streptomyces sp. CL12-4]|nr:hypothetical protein [Streptomyces sp. CL12-4]